MKNNLFIKSNSALRLLLMVASLAVLSACSKETEKYHYMSFETSTGNTVEATEEIDLQAYKGIRRHDDGHDRYFYQVEGHDLNAATLNFVGDEGQTTFEGSDIETFSTFVFQQEDTSVRDIKFLDGKINLTASDDYLEGTFEGRLVRTVRVFGTKARMVQDTVSVNNGYFKVSITEEYEQG